jgi:uncharacterized protein
MQALTEAKLLRVFIGESARSDHRPLYEAIVLKAREAGLAGATVLRGPMGFGHSHSLHSQNILELSADLPLIVEIIDSEAKIDAFLPLLDAMMANAKGLITLAKVQALHYGSAAPGA